MKDYDWLSETRILSYDEPGMIPADLLVLVGKVRKLCRVKPIRIAASAVMDGWNGRYRVVSSFVLEMLYKGSVCVGCTGRVQERRVSTIRRWSWENKIKLGNFSYRFMKRNSSSTNI